MDLALALARVAADQGDVPVGAVLLDSQGRVKGQGYNRRQAQGSPLAHAEIEAITQAGGIDTSHLVGSGDGQEHPSHPGHSSHPGHPFHQGRDSVGSPTDLKIPSLPDQGLEVHLIHRGTAGWNLSGCTLVVTLEPCPMCAGAILACHLSRVVFGAWDPKMGACGSVWDILRDPHIGPNAEVIGGVEEGACADLLRDFFTSHRE